MHLLIVSRDASDLNLVNIPFSIAFIAPVLVYSSNLLLVFFTWNLNLNVHGQFLQYLFVEKNALLY